MTSARDLRELNGARRRESHTVDLYAWPNVIRPALPPDPPIALRGVLVSDWYDHHRSCGARGNGATGYGS